MTLTLGPDTVDTYTGRVYLAAAQGRLEPRGGDWWFDPNPLFFVDVNNWTPGTPLVLTADTPGYPVKTLGELPDGDWSLQAIIRTSDRRASALRGGGTVHCRPVRVPVNGMAEAALTLDRIEPHRSALRPGSGMALFEHQSELLSKHFGTPFALRAVVRMPKGHDGTTALPTLYVIGGFPGALGSAGMVPWLYGPQADADQVAIVYLEAEYRGGHSVFADSPAGGPWGTALVTELLPALEAAFPLRSDRDGRFLTGHSSGGWASLWLALEHPNVFGGTVSTSPDPVDFTGFQTVDIYAPEANIYTSPDGTDAPVARRSGRVMATARNFIAIESIMGEGGQMRSFEWSFSPRGDDGLPVALWNRATGRIDPAVAEHWRKYDIADRIRREWGTLAPVLRDRVLIIMGESDTFYLDAAARTLDAELTARGLPDVVELIPGDHSSVLTPAVAKRTLARLAEQLKIATPVDQPTQP